MTLKEWRHYTDSRVCWAAPHALLTASSVPKLPYVSRIRMFTRAYRKLARGHVVIATFALDGPASCSGLPVRRYGVEELAEEFSGLLRLVGARRKKHVTPAGTVQPFIFTHFVRR